MKRIKDKFTRDWIIENSEEIVSDYAYGDLTVRGLHYQLVTRGGMTNTIQHYKRVVAAMEKARWGGRVAFQVFSDHDREIIGSTDANETFLDDEISYGKDQIKAWMTHYSKNKWESQPYYPEVFIEKKALIGTFQKVCRKHDVALGACKGYPSLTFLNQAKCRFQEAEQRGQQPIILYFGDYDPSGEDIPRSIRDNLLRFGVDVEIRRIALMKEQVLEWNLPSAPTKPGDSRSVFWDGIGQVELDAVEPKKLQRMCADVIDEVLDIDIYDRIMEQESQEQKEYRTELKSFVEQL